MKLANFVVVLYLYATPCSFSRASSLGFSSSGSGCRNHALHQLVHVSQEHGGKRHAKSRHPVRACACHHTLPQRHSSTALPSMPEKKQRDL